MSTAVYHSDIFPGTECTQTLSGNIRIANRAILQGTSHLQGKMSVSFMQDINLPRKSMEAVLGVLGITRTAAASKRSKCRHHRPVYAEALWYLMTGCSVREWNLKIRNQLSSPQPPLRTNSSGFSQCCTECLGSLWIGGMSLIDTINMLSA